MFSYLKLGFELHEQNDLLKVKKKLFNVEIVLRSVETLQILKWL